MKKLMHKIRGSKSGAKIQKQNVASVSEDRDFNHDSSKHVVDTQDPTLITRPPAPGPGPGPNHRDTVSPVSTQDDVGTFSGFDSWLSSFTPDPHERNIVEMPVQQVHREVLVMKGFTPDDYMTITLNGVKKSSHAQKFTVAIQGPYFMTLPQVNNLLELHGFEKVISAKHARAAVPQWNPNQAMPKEFQIFAVEGSSCYDPDAQTGLLINKDESLGDFTENIRRLRVRCKDDKVEATSFPAKLEITFNRTLRLPEDGKLHNQPSGVGHIPVSNIACISKKLQKSGNASLVDMARKGGVFFPLYQREAMFLSFKATNDNFAVRTFVGGVNVVSGLPWNLPPSQRSSKQDYVSVPPQKFLDGIATGEEIVRQFVAMPLGSGYSVEKQVTGKEDVGGMQLEIIPGNQWYVRPQLATNTTAYTYKTPRSLNQGYVILDWRFPDMRGNSILDTSESAEPWVKEHSPIYMRHLYTSQLMHYQLSSAWLPGTEVYMTAVYKLNLLLSYEQNGAHHTMSVEWAPWWTLEDCIQERCQARVEILGTSFNNRNLKFLYRGKALQDCCLSEQGIEDESIIQVVLLQYQPPGPDHQWQHTPYPQQAYGSQPPPGMQQQPQQARYSAQSASPATAPTSPQYSHSSPPTSVPEPYSSPGSSASLQAYHGAQPPQPQRYSPRPSGEPPQNYGQRYSAPSTVGWPSSASPGSHSYAVSSPTSPSSVVPSSPGWGGPQTSAQGSVAWASAQLRASKFRAPHEHVASQPSQSPSMRMSVGETYTSSYSMAYEGEGSGRNSAPAVELAISSPSSPSLAPTYSSPPRSDTATSWSSRPAPTQDRPKPPDQTGWAMGIAAGSRIHQVINKDPFSFSAWCKHRATILSIQILNSVAFESLTGMLAPPSPITPQMYKQHGLPFFASYGEAVTTDGQHTLFGVKSVGELDSESGNIQLGSTLSGSTKVACTCCRRMLCDSILRPCNHTFCSSCVSSYMTYNNAVFCRICNTRVSKLLGFSAPMALPGEDRADFSDAKVVTLEPQKGSVGFHSIYELEGTTHTHTSILTYEMDGQHQGTYVQQTTHELPA